MNVRFSGEARADLARIEAYIRLHNPRRSVSFARELVASCKSIGDVPLGFPVIASRASSELSRKVHKHYLIIYTVRERTVQIVRVLHGAQDVGRILFADEP